MQSRCFGSRAFCASLLSAVLLAAACASTTDGEAQLGESGNNSSSPSADRQRVSEPLDISAYLSDPCGLVSVEKLGELGFSPGDGEAHLPEDDEFAAQTGPACGWVGQGNGSISVIITSKNTERGVGGLEGLRALYEQGRYRLWEETFVADYPAAYLGVSDARSRGDCNIAVGIADDMAFSVTASSFRDNPAMACQVADEVAVDVIENLKGER